MALIECPECGRKISDKAELCPQCGLPRKYFFLHEDENNTPDTDSETPKPSLSTQQTKGAELYDPYQMLNDFLNEYISLMFDEEYVSNRLCNNIYHKYERLYSDVKTLGASAIAEKYTVELSQLEYFADKMNALNKEMELHNDWYIDNQLMVSKGYLDGILSDIDASINLDDEQRKVVLSDEDYSLIVAGAGAGKTTTLAAKVKYLVEKKNIKPEEIIVISYTNKAVKELAGKINKKLKIPVNVMTFHAFGNAIIRESVERMPEPESYKRKYFVEILKNKVLDNPALLKKLVLFFGYYLDIPPEALKFHTLEQYHDYRASLDYETLRSTLGQYEKIVSDEKLGKNRTIRGEFLRSVQEVQIANYLYLHGIDYEYEKVYEYRIPNAKKMYTPDFYIKQNGKVAYLEHFGITEDGKSSLYQKEELKIYKKHVNEKVKIHKQYGTTLLYTFSEYNDGRSFLEHLEELLKSAGFDVTPRDEKEVYRQLVEREKDKYIYRFAIFVETFIGKFKTNGYEREQFDILRSKTDSVRNRLFLDIAEEVYVQYQAMLEKHNKIDFEDMINFAEKKLEEKQNLGERLDYKYIIIDEYQDIARQRFNLTKRLTDVSDAKVIAVGDDWQSIYSFSGSDIHLFTEFIELMGSGKMLQITKTYRNSQELIDIAGNFVQENNTQIRKKLHSPKHIENPIVIADYDDTSSILKHKADALLWVFDNIISEFGENAEILLISRYNFEIYQFCKQGVLTRDEKTGKVTCEKFPKLRLTYMTAHSSKGLGYENVVILNGVAGKFGFPSQIEDDPIMKMVTVNDYSMPYAEERRLFYVALTRTKNRVFILTPHSKPSPFVIELINKYHLKCNENIDLRCSGQVATRFICPDCGWPLKKEYNINYGLQLFLCTNEPEICDFMTNNIECPKDIHRCDKCDSGYMVVKKSKNNQYFFGCTSFYTKGVNCKNTEIIGTRAWF